MAFSERDTIPANFLQSETTDIFDDSEPGIDTGRMVEHLSGPRDLDLLVAAFEQGNTMTRDASYLTSRQRVEIANMGRRNWANGAIELGDFSQVINQSADQFAKLMSDEVPSGLQDNAGWNFLVNAQGFVNNGFPWATNFNDQLGKSMGVSDESAIDTLLYRALVGVTSEQKLRQTIADFARNDENKFHLAWYMAERSLVSEDYQQEKYQDKLDQAKIDATNTINSLGDYYKLSTESKTRACKQIELADFSGFDHLLDGVTSGDRGVSGDYIIGTLRVEVKFSGDPSSPGDPALPDEILHHELFHASAAQSIDGIAGLQTGEYEGREVNEAMTEFLSRVSMGKITYIDSRVQLPIETGFYQNGVAIMADIAENMPVVFSCLLKAYYGEVSDKQGLSLSLNIFYSYLA